MMYSGIIAVSSQIHTKHINTLHGQNVEILLMLHLVIVTTELQKVPVPGVGHHRSPRISTTKILPFPRQQIVSALNEMNLSTDDKFSGHACPTY
jgi:hypothetical protein